MYLLNFQNVVVLHFYRQNNKVEILHDIEVTFSPDDKINIDINFGWARKLIEAWMPENDMPSHTGKPDEI